MQRMKKLLPIVMLLMTASAANAGGLVTKHASSVQLNVDAARSTATRIGSSFGIAGSNIDTTDGSTAGTVSAGTITSGVYSLGNHCSDSRYSRFKLFSCWLYPSRCCSY